MKFVTPLGLVGIIVLLIKGESAIKSVPVMFISASICSLILDSLCEWSYGTIRILILLKILGLSVSDQLLNRYTVSVKFLFSRDIFLWLMNFWEKDYHYF